MIIVTGLARSGTSAMAKLLHESGIDMGMTFLAPPPNLKDMTIEYEESIGSLSLIKENRFPEGYFDFREKTKRTKEWGFKSPLCMFHLEELQARKAVIVKMERDFSEIEASVNRCIGAVDFLRGVNSRLMEIEIPDAIIVKNHELRNDPESVRERVLEVIKCRG